MPRVPNLLHRFAPAGAPGSAGVAGVPADRAADHAAELTPLLAQLADTEARCDEILDQARRDAAANVEHAAQQVHAIAASEQQRAVSERADATARARTALTQQNEAELAAARELAARVREHGADRVPDYVARVTAAIADMIAAPPATDAA